MDQWIINRLVNRIEVCGRGGHVTVLIGDAPPVEIINKYGNCAPASIVSNYRAEFLPRFLQKTSRPEPCRH